MNLLEAMELAQKDIDRNGAESSRPTYQWHRENAEAYWGPVDLGEISRREVQRWIDVRRLEVGAATLAHELSYLARLYKVAWKNGYEVTNPCHDLDKPRIRNKRKRVMTGAEEDAIGGLMSARDFSLVQFLVHSSLRRFEVFRLKPQDLDIFTKVVDGRILRVGIAMIHESKTGASRTCALNPIAVEIAQAWMDAEPGEYVFLSSRKGKRLNVATTMTKKFHDHCNKLGILDLRLHDLRRTAASRASANGAHVEDIQQLLGHQSVQMTERYITRENDPMWRAAMAIYGYKKAA